MRSHLAIRLAEASALSEPALNQEGGDVLKAVRWRFS
jgi:hypothetical protein